MSVEFPADQSGFFNSSGGDRAYNATHFARYLEGIVGNGVTPQLTGFQAFVNPDQSPVPSVRIRAGKAFLNGYWVYNYDELVYSLGEPIQTVGKYLIYLCVDIGDSGRNAKLDHIFVASPGEPTVPESTATKFYLGIAKVTNNTGSQPTSGNIDDSIRTGAGIVTVIPARSIVADQLEVDSVGPTELMDHSVGIYHLAKTGFLVGAWAASYEANHGPAANQEFVWSSGATILNNYIPPDDVNLLIFGSWEGRHISPKPSGDTVFDYTLWLKNGDGTIVGASVSTFFVKATASSTTQSFSMFGRAISMVIPLTYNVPCSLTIGGKFGYNGHTFQNMRANGMILALPRQA